MEFNRLTIQDLQLEHFVDVNPGTGSASIGVTVPVSEGRGNFTPALSLHYSSSPRNSVFGIGWSLAGLPFLSIDTKPGLPKYDGSDQYAFNGIDSLVPVFIQAGASWHQRVDETADYWIYYYRSKQEEYFTRFEKWVKKTDGVVHWRTRSKNNIISVYGLDSSGNTKIYDPENKAKVYLWLLESQYDDTGNAIVCAYQSENAAGLTTQYSSYEVNRLAKFNRFGFAQQYPAKILYGNTKPIRPDEAIAADNRWLFEIAFDYGNYSASLHTNSTPTLTWEKRHDPFSIYTPGFEIRTYRLCRRLLMYHHFDDLAATSLVGSFQCHYAENEAGTTLTSVSYTGVRRDISSGVYFTKTLPELRFSYTQPSISTTFQGIVQETNENLPQGFNNAKTRFVDLFGEGLPGILHETADTWYFKPNLGNGNFGSQEIVINKPSQQTGLYALGDFDQDGNINLFTLQGRNAGFYEYNRDTERWSGFTPLQSIPQVGYSKIMDVNADGLPDLIVEREDKIICYPFKGKEGFGNPYEFAKPVSNGTAYAPTIGDDLSLDYFLADMTGDGLPDQVRIRNGRVEYFPNLGNGHFGERVVMENAPLIDFEVTFDASRIRLYDLDGSGTTDIIYVGNGEIRYWYNASGNTFTEGGKIVNLPYIDSISSAIILDFLGNGTPCLVWSTSLPHLHYSTIQYLELTNGVKPRLVTSLENAMGKEIRLTYSTSSQHYLRDRKTQTPWISKLPNHFTVVDKKEVIDHIAHTTYSSQYKYKDGHYDGKERTFLCFGLVEQYDAELFENQAFTHEKEYAQPSCLKTWFHNGLFGWDRKRASHYYAKDPKQVFLAHQSFERVEALDADAFSMAYRSLTGRPIRQEVFATSPEGVLEEHPFQISQTAYRIRKLQPKVKNYDPAFLGYQSETVSSQYERAADDPRIAHHITISVNEYGDIDQEVNVAYARRTAVAGSLAAQQSDYLTAAVHRFVDTDTVVRYQPGVLVEGQDFEINRFDHPAEGLIRPDEIRLAFAALISSALAFDAPLPTAGPAQARLTAWHRTYFWNNALNAVLPAGQIGVNPLAHHEETACFTPNFVSQVYGGKVTAVQLSDPNEGDYTLNDGYWWQKTPVNHYKGQSEFFNLDTIERSAGNLTTYAYDSYKLNIIEITDAAGNKTKGEIDYNVVEPFRLTDANDNVSEVLYDPLGVAIASFHQGSVLDGANTVRKYGNGLLAEYTIRTDESFSAVLNQPAQYLQQADTYLFYDFDCWKTDAIPLRSVSLLRESLVHDGTGNVNAATTFQVSLEYLDGFGRTLQRKQKVEAGDAIKRVANGQIDTDAGGTVLEEWSASRWLVSGHTVYNNKQQPVRQFEPFFSSLISFEADEVLETYGVSAQTYYDAVGRQIRTEFPDSTFLEIRFTSWDTLSFDQNDTVDRSLYKTFREFLPADNPAKMALAKSLAHKDTPSAVRFDPLGRGISTVETTNDGTGRVVENQFDSNGNVDVIRDARGLTAFTYKRDMLGRTLYENSIDAGEKWSFSNNLDQLIHHWDSRNIRVRTTYDALDRVLTVQIDGALGLNQVTERFVYGEDATLVQARERNLRGQLVKHFDQAGTLETTLFTPHGLPLICERKLLTLFDAEPNWAVLPGSPLSADTFTSRFAYDGLGRPVQQELPDQTTRKFTYQSGGGVQKVTVSTADGTLTNVEILKDTAYDAKGFRKRVLLGNDVDLNYTYEAETFRLSRLLARKTTGGNRTYQDIAYTYDPVGNLVYLLDSAQQPASATPRVLEGLSVSAHAEFDYDALYQLKSATGRVHQALLQHDHQDRSRENNAPNDWGKGTRHITLNNGAAVERYTRKYDYDVSGNIKTIQHQGVTNNWTKQLWTSPTSNRSMLLNDLNGNPIANPESRFDASGNCIYMPHLRSIDWNYRNNIAKVVVIDRSAQNKPDDAEYYVYGGDGMRVRKITQRVVDVANDTIERTETIYLDGCELKRITRGNTELLKRFTSTLTDGTNSLAIIHSWEKDTLARETDAVATKKIHYQLTNHLGSASLELDETGAVITYEEYFPYGGTSFVAGRNKREIDLKTYRYSGKERDDFTGLYYFGYRYYAHWIGGWINPDPLGPEDSENLYLYVHNNPINLVDPNGLQATAPVRRGELYSASPSELSGELRAAAIRFQQSLTPDIQRDYARRGLTHIIYDHRAREFRAVTRAEALAYLRDLSRRGVDSLYITEPEPEPEPNPEDVIDTSHGDVEITFEEGETVIANQEIALPGEGVDSSGPAQGPGGEAADTSGSSRSRDTNSGATHNGTSGGNQTQTNGGGGGGNTGEASRGTGTTGTGSGTGNQGTGPGGGGTGESNRGTGTGTGSGAGTGSGTGQRSGGTTGATGQPGGRPGGVPGGVQGGEIGGSPGGILGGQVGGDLNGDPNGSLDGNINGHPDGVPNGTPDGSATGEGQGTGSQSGTGQQTSGGQGTGQSPGEAGQTTTPNPNARQTQQGQQGQQGGGETNWLDTATRWAGYLNLEFGSNEPGGEAGGIPGGMDLFGWRPPMWVRRALQVTYIVTTIITTVIPIGKLALGAKVAIQGALRVGLRATARRVATAIAAKLPTRAGIRAALQSARGRVSSGLSRIGGLFRRGAGVIDPVIDTNTLIGAFRAARRGSTAPRDLHALAALSNARYQWVVNPTVYREFTSVATGGAARRRFLRSLGNVEVLSGAQARALRSSSRFNEVYSELRAIANRSSAGMGNRAVSLGGGLRSHTHYNDIVSSAFAEALRIPFVTGDNKFLNFLANHGRRVGVTAHNISGY